jgi:hypothetical protein
MNERFEESEHYDWSAVEPELAGLEAQDIQRTIRQEVSTLLPSLPQVSYGFSFVVSSLQEDTRNILLDYSSGFNLNIPPVNALIGL